MINTLTVFKEIWEYETEATLKIFLNMRDNSLNQKFVEGYRTIGAIAWHIVKTLGEMGSQAALTVEFVDEDSPIPATVKEISDVYKKSADSLLNSVLNDWNDENLGDVVEIYGEKWTKEKILRVLIFHQIHHRGQLTVLMRQAGLMVPGIYGPSKEEWESMGLTPQN